MSEIVITIPVIAHPLFFLLLLFFASLAIYYIANFILSLFS
ncbi:hypothetical protein [Candidatus Caldatribacterium sp.]|nr:hypothetical protein [Candidatus Caldatribacterium sp.]